jgi:hypothetical protein
MRYTRPGIGSSTLENFLPQRSQVNFNRSSGAPRPGGRPSAATAPARPRYPETARGIEMLLECLVGIAGYRRPEVVGRVAVRCGRVAPRGRWEAGWAGCRRWRRARARSGRG